ncbi:hypothetical protein CL629_04005 [bacterium]|nr:hypothetical protein [bacterium]
MNEPEEKWEKLLAERRIFNWIPFIDFALVAGSMAMGEETEDSDFDIILGCKTGRMFTARACTVALFSLAGKRRKSAYSKEESKDKFCFNHFVTKDSYTLRPPYNAYWQTLYQNLVPIYGKEAEARKFFEANKWSEKKEIAFDKRWGPKKLNVFQWISESVLKSPLGDLLEKILKKYQLERINRKKPNTENARVYADETELELHPDTTRIDEWVRENNR